MSGPRYSEEEARAAIAASRSYTEALRRLGMRAAGGNHRTIRHYAEEVWRLPVDHFDPDAVRRAAQVADPRPRQRRARRQPPREPADRLRELQRDPGHALRTQQPPTAVSACL